MVFFSVFFFYLFYIFIIFESHDELILNSLLNQALLILTLIPLFPLHSD